jgi:hypothetical protein
MSEKDNTENIRISQVLAGALAAVTAALIGSTMGVAGTVVGAGLASVISTVGGAVYLRSIQRTREGVRTVRAKVVGRSGGATVLVSEEEPSAGEVVEADTAPEETSDEQTPDVSPPSEPRRLRWPVIVVTSLAAFALGMVVITGVEWLHGESLSGGTGTTFGSIVEHHPNMGGGGGQTTEPAQTTTPPTSTTSPTSTDATNTTDPTTTTTPPSSGSSASSTPPVTTTTDPTTPSVPEPPSP